MTVIIVEPMKPARLAEIENDLSTLQSIVGGSIEAVYPWQDRACIVCNDNGKLEGLPLNRSIGYDVIAGTFFVCGLTQSDFGSLSESQVKIYLEKFRYPEAFFGTPENMLCVKIIPPEEKTSGEPQRAKPPKKHTPER